MPMIEMQNLSKVFRTDLVETHALRSISLSIDAGEFVAVMGPSGAGKTTFLNVAGLLEDFTAGSYCLDGEDVTRLSDDQRSRVRNQKLGFVFQSFNLISDLNIYENVDAPLHYRRMPAPERHRRISDVLERVGLSARAKHFPAQLSGGQQQRAAIARALAGSPSVILADEPTGNLDSEMSRQVMELLRQVNTERTTVIMVTHNPELVAQTTRCIRITDGDLVDFREERARRKPESPIVAAV
jgi:putative ABC transport system ATP-binding protein